MDLILKYVLERKNKVLRRIEMYARNKRNAVGGPIRRWGGAVIKIKKKWA